MKKLTAAIFTISAWALCSQAQQNLPGGVDGAQTALENLARSIQAPVEWPPNKWYVQAIPAFVASNGIPADVYAATFSKIAEERIAMYTDPAYARNKSAVSVWIAVAINAMGEIGDSCFLPWLGIQAMASPLPRVKELAAINYVRIAGLDATPFVERIMSGDDEQYGFDCKYATAREFFAQIKQAESKLPNRAKIDAAYEMLVRQAQTMKSCGITWSVDKMLSNQLDAYATSVQREAVLSRFLGGTNELARANFTREHEKVVKTPAAERTDLHGRFPGLTEPAAAEPSQVKAMSNDGVMPMADGSERMERRLKMAADGWTGSNAVQRIKEFAETNGVPALHCRASSNESVKTLTEWMRSGRGKAASFYAYARTNGIPDSVTTGIAKQLLAEAEEKIAAMPVPEVQHPFDPLPQAKHAAGNFVRILGGSGDPNILPFLEEKSRSPLEPVHRQAAFAYVRIAGLDATPFVERILSADDEQYGFDCKYTTARAFFAQIKRAEADVAEKEKIDAAYEMLVRQAQTINYEGHAEQIDLFLCQRLPEYGASRQRELATSRFIDSKFDHARRFFREQHAAIMAVPAAERTDLRGRFPGLTEPAAAEPSQVKAMSNDGVMPMADGSERMERRLKMAADGWTGSNAVQRIKEFAETNGVPALHCRASSNESVKTLTEWMRSGRGKAASFYAYARTNGIPDSVTTGIAKQLLAEAEEKIAAMPVPEVQHPFDPLPQAKHAAGNFVRILGGSGDPDILPFLEEKSRSPLEPVHRQAAFAYVRIAGLDATPFVERILSADDEQYGFDCKYTTAREFFAQIKRAEADVAEKEKIDAAYEMLVRQAQTITQRAGAWEFDDMLSNALPEYKTSFQREGALERHRADTNEVARTHFLKELDVLRETPAAERTDLRDRFPGLAKPAAAEPSQVKAMSNDGVMPPADGQEPAGTTVGDEIEEFWRTNSPGVLATNIPQAQVGESNMVYVITTQLYYGEPQDMAVLRVGDATVPILPGTQIVARVSVPRNGSASFQLLPAPGLSPSARALLELIDIETPPPTAQTGSFPMLDDPSGIFDTSKLEQKQNVNFYRISEAIAEPPRAELSEE